MTQSQFTPNLARISVFSAVILLAYTLAGMVNIPAQEFAAQLPGIYLEIQINVQTIVSLLVAILAASGTEWLLREHPSSGDRSLVLHLLLPTLTAWVIGIPLQQDQPGVYGGLGILLGGGALILVLVAEFIAVDREDPRQPIALLGLTSVAYALFFLLAVILRALEFRLFLLLPTLTLVSGLISLRLLNLRARGQWIYLAAGLIALMMAEITTAAHYLPLASFSFGLFLLGAVYGLTSLFSNFGEGKVRRAAVSEPAIVIAIIWGAAILLGS